VSVFVVETDCVKGLKSSHCSAALGTPCELTRDHCWLQETQARHTEMLTDIAQLGEQLAAVRTECTARTAAMAAASSATKVHSSSVTLQWSR
jgi:hypothetical protein